MKIVNKTGFQVIPVAYIDGTVFLQLYDMLLPTILMCKNYCRLRVSFISLFLVA